MCWFDKNEELCSLSLVDTVISEQCANGLTQFEMKTCHFPAVTSEIQRNSICIFLGFLNQENCLHSCNFSHVKYFWMSENLILLPLLFSNDFPGYRGIQCVHDFLVFWVISNFFKYQKSQFSHLGLPVNSHANITYSFPKLKNTTYMIRSNCFSFITLIACTAPPMPETLLVCDIDLLYCPK